MSAINSSSEPNQTLLRTCLVNYSMLRPGPALQFYVLLEMSTVKALLSIATQQHVSLECGWQFVILGAEEYAKRLVASGR